MPDLHSTNKVNECRSLVDRGARQGQSLDGDGVLRRSCCFPPLPNETFDTRADPCMQVAQQTLCPSPSVNRLAGALIGSRPPINTLSEFVLSSSNPLQLTLHDPTPRAFQRRVYSQILTGGNIPPCPDEPSHAETIVDWYPTGTMHLQIYSSLLSIRHGVHQYPRPGFAVVQSSVSFPNRLPGPFDASAAPDGVDDRVGTTNVTPRHYLDFISHYVRLYTEKRDELEEQQRHLHVGLDKLRDTVTQEAEQKKAASIEIQAALVEQDKHIEQRRAIATADLADAEPAVLDAQTAVSNIKKQHLQEVRGMANPPEAVKLAMESVCTILGHKIDSWRTVQTILRRDDFISGILKFDTTTQMTKQLRDTTKRDFLSRPSYNFETVQPQVRFSEILDKVEPLRNEVQSLEVEAETTKKQAQAIIQMIAELEAKIAKYKEEYALLISETQAIKSEMERVQSKVDRSMKLLESLSSKRGRWESDSRTFDTEMSTIVGDVLLSAAFLAYGGFFDQHYREVMWQEWSNHLSEANIKYKPELSLTEYLSTADDRLSWQSKSLPSDNLTTENAIMLKRFNRYPLIIDPTGQATTFLLNEYKERKITVTSFLDEAFLKVLESALRFGNPLLIQEVEHLDLILNAVLNKEIRRTGGRVLIRLGSQDIDFSPSFTMFLSTRDPSVEFSPDICSFSTMYISKSGAHY
ncbi:microtubule-binding stalk of dynein motor-domain-containing protein [Mycena galericulata]|nr:microtubule-binding stalk of dynein motor-domain-containing protein [Mycena galericulata]